MIEPDVAEIMPPGLESAEAHRPLFEVLFLSAQPAARWPTLAGDVRRLLDDALVRTLRDFPEQKIRWRRCRLHE